ncbi:MAG: porin family protein [Oscillatoria sp. PMC 1051.18]|uniref:porin family protein n=1 Tax=Oscillatoria salina TaxID=331517 RepID=UPI0013BB8D92|nr:porin family protein [Oscillatoria salina]MBZ8179795.1 porin family protein [Oscillatoria salina IIICB1]MEC4893023.1 porin family protein [Oscillatoria sp. PMC 1050.18]MEC5033304.1 porin family protein [Oscillatoria sp. PMC 1051.18]NET87694.1 porin family protein [Kamptonema sp. SIO1D9]
MKASLKSVVALSALSAVAIAPLVLSAGAAYADTGAYIGGGASYGFDDGDEDDVSGNIQGNLPVLNGKVSVRGAVLYSEDNSAIVPMATYNVRINNRINGYVGGGYSLVQEEGEQTSVGVQDAPVAVVGVEGRVTDDIVGYADTKIGINAGETDNTVFGVHAGVGLRLR